MADQILFDRLEYIDRLKRAGIDEAQARAHGEALDAALRESVATKADIDGLRTATKADIADLRTATKADIAELRTATKVDIDGLRTITTALDHKIDIAVRDMTIRTGAMLIVLGGFLASIKFFG